MATSGAFSFCSQLYFPVGKLFDVGVRLRQDIFDGISFKTVSNPAWEETLVLASRLWLFNCRIES